MLKKRRTYLRNGTSSRIAQCRQIGQVAYLAAIETFFRQNFATFWATKNQLGYFYFSALLNPKQN